MAAYRWKYFEENEDRPEKPRSYGVTEMRGPHYSLLSQNVLQIGDVNNRGSVLLKELNRGEVIGLQLPRRSDNESRGPIHIGENGKWHCLQGAWGRVGCGQPTTRVGVQEKEEEEEG
ncbi:hypothetical protein FF1_025504 [Malus domestica]